MGEQGGISAKSAAHHESELAVLRVVEVTDARFRSRAYQSNHTTVIGGQRIVASESRPAVREPLGRTPSIESAAKMKRLWISSGCLFVALAGFVLWYTLASDYGDGVASGVYRFSQDGQISTLILRPATASNNS
jgi:hypothetical protein